MATCHFYHNSYFRRFHSVYKLRLLLVTFDLWFVTSKLQRLQHHHLARSHHLAQSHHLAIWLGPTIWLGLNLKIRNPVKQPTQRHNKRICQLFFTLFFPVEHQAGSAMANSLHHPRMEDPQLCVGTTPQ